MDICEEEKDRLSQKANKLICTFSSPNSSESPSGKTMITAIFSSIPKNLVTIRHVFETIYDKKSYFDPISGQAVRACSTRQKAPSV
jgi:hypothetical protein